MLLFVLLMILAACSDLLRTEFFEVYDYHFTLTAGCLCSTYVCLIDLHSYVVAFMCLNVMIYNTIIKIRVWVSLLDCVLMYILHLCVHAHMFKSTTSFITIPGLCILSMQVCSCVRMMNISGGSNKSWIEMFRRK